MVQRLRESESLETGLRRLAVEGIDTALAALDGTDGHDVAIHSVRKQCKKSRALLRLFRFGIGAARRKECRFFRDLGRSLSAVRDGKVALDVHAMLLERYGAMLDPAVGAGVRQQLIADVQAVGSAAEGSGLKPPDDDTLRQRLLSARLRARRWKLGADDDRLLRKGLARTYRRGRDAARHAAASGAKEHFHESRKRAKDYWYQLDLVARRWPDAALKRIGPTRKLTEVLGEAHDLEIYCNAIRNAAAARNPEATEILSALAERRARELETESVALAREVFAEKPKRFVAELERPRPLQQAAG